MNGGRNRDGKGARLCSHRLTFNDVKSGTKTWKDAEDKEGTWPPYSAQQTDLSLFQGRLGHCIQANEAPRLATNCNRKDAKLSLIVNAALTCAPRSSALGQPLFPKSGSRLRHGPPTPRRSRDHLDSPGVSWTVEGFGSGYLVRVLGARPRHLDLSIQGSAANQPFRARPFMGVRSSSIRKQGRGWRLPGAWTRRP
jgi:hypothetical protein